MQGDDVRLTVLARIDDEHLHAPMVVQVGEQLGRDEEVLSRVGTASRLDELVVHRSLGLLVHPLVDLIHEREGRACHFG